MSIPAFLVLLLTLLLASCGGNSHVASVPTQPVACKQDAMQCPDGSWVERSGAKCEFVCPNAQTKGTP